MSLRYVVLSLLDRAPRSGYDVVKSFDSSVGYFWQASHQQVYRELAQLHDLGWVAFTVEPGGDRPDRKVYRLADGGRQALREWLRRPLPAQKIRAPLLLKLYAADTHDAATLAAELSLRRKETAERLADYRRIEARHYVPSPNARWPFRERMLYLTLRRGMLDAEQDLVWLDEAIGVLREHEGTDR